MDRYCEHSPGHENEPVARPVALDRAREARAQMSSCRLCALDCGVDRTCGPAGACHAPATARVFGLSVDWAGEEDLVPSFVISLSGCNLKCSFCITAPGSQDATIGSPVEPAAVAAKVVAQADRIRSFSILGGEPTIHLPSALEIAARIPASIPFVWKTNALASDGALRLLDGIPDRVLADHKFGNDRCAWTLARVPRYLSAVERNLRWYREHSRLVVRHLLMPGHFDCCFVPVAHWLARHLAGTPLSLMEGYTPMHRAVSHPGLSRPLPVEDSRRAREMVRRLGIPLVPWRLEPPAGAERAELDHDRIWIEPGGRVRAFAASPALAACLRNLNQEMGLGEPQP